MKYLCMSLLSFAVYKRLFSSSRGTLNAKKKKEKTTITLESDDWCVFFKKKKKNTVYRNSTETGFLLPFVSTRQFIGKQHCEKCNTFLFMSNAFYLLLNRSQDENQLVRYMTLIKVLCEHCIRCKHCKFIGLITITITITHFLLSESYLRETIVFQEMLHFGVLTRDILTRDSFSLTFRNRSL